MLRISPIADARKAEGYYAKSDGGYYLKAEDLGREWGGKGAAMLGLTGPPDFEQFKRLIHGLDPHTGEQLTAKLIEDRLAGWDVTVSVPKGVTTALERGDDRLREALWEAGREAMADIEALRHDAGAQGRQAGGPRHRQSRVVRRRASGNAARQGRQHAGLGPASALRRVQRDQGRGRGEVEGGQVPADHGPARNCSTGVSTCDFASKVADLGYEIETKWGADGQGQPQVRGLGHQGHPAAGAHALLAAEPGG